MHTLEYYYSTSTSTTYSRSSTMYAYSAAFTLHFKHVVTGTEPTLESVAVRMHANRIPHKKSDRQK